jgi:hypothetical protein
VEDVYFFKFFSQVFSFIGAKNAHGQANQGPQMDHAVIAAIMVAELMDLGMAVVAAGDAVVCAGGLDLIIFDFPVSQAFILEAGLEKSAAAAAAKVVGAVGHHIDEIFFADNGFHHKPQVVGNRVAIAFSDDLTGILDRKFNFQVFVPVGVNLEFTFTDPFGIVFVNIFYFKVMFEVEFFQSGPD